MLQKPTVLNWPWGEIVLSSQERQVWEMAGLEKKKWFWDWVYKIAAKYFSNFYIFKNKMNKKQLISLFILA